MTEDDEDVINSKVTDYIMETGKSISSIKRRTEALIADGWRPIGGASTYLNDKTMIVFTQSLVRTGTSDSGPNYDIISALSPTSLADKVKTRLGGNWVPSGSGFVFRNESGNFIFCQTIIH